MQFARLTSAVLVLALWLPTFHVAADTSQLFDIASCLTSPNCSAYAYTDAAQSLLVGADGAIIAHCVAGMTRSLSRQSVYESMSKFVVDALLPAKSDFFFALGKTETWQTTTFGWMGAFSHFNVVGASLSSNGTQRTRLDECYAMIKSVEVATGRNYTHVLRQRSDLRWLAPIPAAVLNESKQVHLYDIVGLCQRSEVSTEYPCDVPNAADMRADPYFQVSFERMNEPLTALERHLEWTWWYKESLKKYILKNDPFDPGRAKELALRYFTSICFKYDYIVHEHLFYDVPKHDFIPAERQQCSLNDLESSKWMAIFRSVGNASALAALLDQLDVGGVVGHYVQGSHPPPGYHKHFDNLCSCRWQVCGNSRYGSESANVTAMLVDMCALHFKVPFMSRQYFYHAPALQPNFADSTFDVPDILLSNTSGEKKAARCLNVSGEKALKIAILIVGQIKTENQHALTIESIRSRILDAYRRMGHTVDVYLCERLQATDRALSEVLSRLLPYTVYDVNATNQFEREEMCHIHFAADHKDSDYEWFLRLRPDLAFWEDAPDPRTLDPSYIHARVLSAINISGLTQGSISHGWIDETCWAGVCMPGSCATSCAVYDDQFAIIPWTLAKAYFESHAAETRPPPTIEEVECKLTRNGFPEGFFTRSVIRSGGRFTPLNLESRLFMYKGTVPNASRVGVVFDC